MEKAKKERKPRETKPKTETKVKVEKPKAKSKPTLLDTLEDRLMGNHSLQSEEWFKPSFQNDLRIVENETTKKLKKVQENTKLSAEEKLKKINKIVAENTKILMKLADDYKTNPDFYKSMYYKKKQ